MMKKLGFIFLMLISVSAFAQNRQGGQGSNMTPEERTDMMVTRMTEELKLNEDQQKQLKEVFLQQAKERAERREANGNRQNREARMEAMQMQREALQKKLKTIFTEEQFTQYQKIANEQRQRWNRQRDTN